jgi:hypothetical protein
VQVTNVEHRLPRRQRHEHGFVHVRIVRAEISGDGKRAFADRNPLALGLETLSEQFPPRRSAHDDRIVAAETPAEPFPAVNVGERGSGPANLRKKLSMSRFHECAVAYPWRNMLNAGNTADCLCVFERQRGCRAEAARDVHAFAATRVVTGADLDNVGAGGFERRLDRSART